MKIKKDFSPVTITLEYKEDVELFRSFMMIVMKKEQSGFCGYQRDPSERYRKAEYLLNMLEHY